MSLLTWIEGKSFPRISGAAELSTMYIRYANAGRARDSEPNQ